MKDREPSLDELWNSVSPSGRTFDPKSHANLPLPVQQYLAHAIAPGTPLATICRLRMHGKIKLKRWRAFKAEQVIARDRGMIWQARMRIAGLPLRGSDRFLDGQGAMLWRLLGTIPVTRASGPDVTRSAAGRIAAESIWLPSWLCDDRVWWRVAGSNVAQARLAIDGHAAELALTLDQGRLRSVSLLRWGNPDGGPFHEVPFGAFVDQEARFGGYTIPVRLRVGWHFDDPHRFDREGLFFEVSIDDAEYR
jgi:hypothetical protein